LKFPVYITIGVAVPSMALASSAFPLSSAAIVTALPFSIVCGLFGPLLQIRRSKRRARFYVVASVYCAITVAFFGTLFSNFVPRIFGITFFNADHPGKVLTITIATCTVIAIVTIAALPRIRRWIDETSKFVAT